MTQMGSTSTEIKEHAEFVSQKLTISLDTSAQNMLQRYPIEMYCDLLKNYPKIGTYKYYQE